MGEKLYLTYRLRAKGVTDAEVTDLIGVSEKTWRNKKSGKTDLTWNEARKIRESFFPDEPYERLYAEE